MIYDTRGIFLKKENSKNTCFVAFLVVILLLMGILTSGRNKDTLLDKFAPASSFIETVEYDAENSTMDITFRTGSKIRYVGVAPNTYLTFKKSPTHSAFYARAIKGNLQSVQIISNDVGTNKSTPLNQVHREKPLDAGLRKQQARERRIFGTVERAINAAVVDS